MRWKDQTVAEASREEVAEGKVVRCLKWVEDSMAVVWEAVVLVAEWVVAGQEAE
jgi:hypothetical protein